VRALVTGSDGFLGRHVAQHLAELRGWEVRGFDLRDAGATAIPAIRGDLCDLAAIMRASRDVEVVVHFGGVGDVDVAEADPGLATRSNVEGTTNVALAALENGARVVHASSWEVYGTPLREHVDEDHPCAPAQFYGATKLAAEQMLRAAAEGRSLPVVILRLGTAYGRGMRRNTVFRRFVDRARDGQPLVVQGTGEQWRQFTHTSDICRAVTRACVVTSGLSVLNIASDERVTIRALAESIASAHGVPIMFAPARNGDPLPGVITSERARRVLGWEAQMPFSRGLEDLLATDGAREGRLNQAR
jgi:UDP-glucose 4-epimerase